MVTTIKKLFDRSLEVYLNGERPIPYALKLAFEVVANLESVMWGNKMRCLDHALNAFLAEDGGEYYTHVRRAFREGDFLEIDFQESEPGVIHLVLGWYQYEGSKTSGARELARTDIDFRDSGASTRRFLYRRRT